jgi:hypothetical protein
MIGMTCQNEFPLAIPAVRNVTGNRTLRVAGELAELAKFCVALCEQIVV